MLQLNIFTFVLAGIWLGAGLAAWWLLRGIGHAPWREGRLHGGGLLAWVSLVGLMGGVLHGILFTGIVAWNGLNGASLATIAPAGDPGLPEMMVWSMWFAVGAATVALAAAVLGVMMALWLGRRIDWQAAQASLGWSFADRRWTVLALAAAGWLAWPLTIASSVLWIPIMVTESRGMESPDDLAGLFELSQMIALPVIGLVLPILAVAVVARPAGRLTTAWMASARSAPQPWLARTRAERAVIWIGVVGFLTAGLMAIPDRLLEIVPRTLAAISLTGVSMNDWFTWYYLTTAILGLVALLGAVGLVWKRFPWPALEALTTWHLSTAWRAVAALAIASTLLWPLQGLQWLLEQGLVAAPTMPAWGWQALGLGLLALAIIWLFRWRPQGDTS